MAGSGNPASQNVSVTNTGGGTLSGLATSVTYVTGTSGWLTASLNGTTAPATLSIQATTGALAPGTYTANVAVTSNVAANSPQAVTVTFTVAPVPPPAAPTNLNANGQGNMIRVTWDDNSNNEQSFEVQRNTTGANGPWTTIASLPANIVDYRDRNYVSGVTYWYRVLACNAGGCTSSNVDTGSN
jgi:predicted phage tail protein